MGYERLSDFITDVMRMSHVYQPVVLKALLESGGESDVDELSKSLLLEDRSQIEYYEKILKEMPGAVLRRHGIIKPVTSGRRIVGYRLEGFEELSEGEVKELKALCQTKINEYINRRGSAIWSHRRLSLGSIPGSLKYEVLKRAGFHCELCGIRADEKALEVDHIVPRNRGGSDDTYNLQALCYSCNAMKRDHDDTDFHALRQSFEHREKDCLFCEIPSARVVKENSLAYMVRDGFPVTEGHSLIIPKRHVAEYFDLTRAELNAVNRLIRGTREELCKADESIKGFNIGVNIGDAAGQTVFHSHIHLIPRRDGDVENPTGGVRHLIPGKGYY